MITLTPRAAARIRELADGQAEPSKALRVFIEPGGCSGFEYGMGFAEPVAGDVALESEGLTFYTDPASLDYLKGSVVDFDDGLNGKGFEVRNPNAQQTCGCGKSFN